MKAAPRNSARAVIQAENFAAGYGVQTEPTTDTGRGQNLCWNAHGDWVRYAALDFGSTPATRFQARIASGAPQWTIGTVQIHLDSLNSVPVGRFNVSNTGDWQAWRTVTTSIAPTTGKHTLFLRFVSAKDPEFVNINWFTFK